MDKLGAQIVRFCCDETGATAAEYAIIAAGIAGAIITAVTTLGSKVLNTYTTVDTNM